MEQHDLCTALIEAWGQVFADYQKARIHNETDLMISLAKHLEKKHDDGMVVAESLIQLEAASKAQKHPDLVWAKVITGRAVKKDDVRKAEALAVIELKYEHFPKAKIDTDKLQHFQNYMTESRNPVAKAGFNWSRTYTEIRLGADTLMVLGLVGRQDAEALCEHFAENIWAQCTTSTCDLLILQIIEPWEVVGKRGKQLDGDPFPQAYLVPGKRTLVQR